jgi:hydrogenase maturation protease
MARILVAGIGNIFFRDDGFGPAVAAAVLASGQRLPDGVVVVDYGIRGMHLTFDLLAGVDALVLVDAVPSNGAAAERTPGSITVLRVGPDDLGGAEFDAHGMQPVSVLASLSSMSGALPPTYLVGCVPADTSEGIGLSEPVAAAVEPATAVVVELVNRLVDDPFASGAPVGGTALRHPAAEV